MKLGVFGGTFNPIHLGHLIAAEDVYEKLNLDRIVFIPSMRPPHKLKEKVLNPIHRYKMTELAIKDNPNFVSLANNWLFSNSA